jgi:dimethylamine/trimethylamine dehydrogenase
MLGNAVEILSCNTAVLCTARESRTELYDALYGRRSEWAGRGIEVILRARDCLAPRYLADAIFDGHHIAGEFESANPERPRAIIRSARSGAKRSIRSWAIRCCNPLPDTV